MPAEKALHADAADLIAAAQPKRCGCQTGQCQLQGFPRIGVIVGVTVSVCAGAAVGIYFAIQTLIKNL